MYNELMKDHIKFASNWQRYKHSVRVFHGSFAETVSPFLFLLYPAGRRGTVSLPPAPLLPFHLLLLLLLFSRPPTPHSGPRTPVCSAQMSASAS